MSGKRRLPSNRFRLHCWNVRGSKEPHFIMTIVLLLLARDNYLNDFRSLNWRGHELDIPEKWPINGFIK
jgi:hypothetical protein